MMSKANNEIEKLIQSTDKQSDNPKVDNSEEQLKATPDRLRNAKIICQMRRMDTPEFRDRLCYIGNRLIKIDHIIKKITRIVEKQATKEPGQTHENRLPFYRQQKCRLSLIISLLMLV